MMDGAPPPLEIVHMAGIPEETDQVQPPLVLVVDDYPDTRDVYARFLALSGFRAEQAHNGQEAIKKTRALLPDLILLDLLMPGLDGWEVARRIKTDELTRGVRIIAVTADATPSRHRIAKKAGCDAVMIKPCAPDALLLEIHRVLGIPCPSPFGVDGGVYAPGALEPDGDGNGRHGR